MDPKLSSTTCSYSNTAHKIYPWFPASPAGPLFGTWYWFSPSPASIRITWPADSHENTWSTMMDMTKESPNKYWSNPRPNLKSGLLIWITLVNNCSRYIHTQESNRKLPAIYGDPHSKRGAQSPPIAPHENEVNYCHVYAICDKVSKCWRWIMYSRSI